MIEINKLLDTISSIKQIDILNILNPTIKSKFTSSQNFYSELEKKI